MKPEQFLFGCAYYDEYMPDSRIDEDFSLMKEAGMNAIRIGESTWSTWEPREGEFNFSSLIKMLEGARKYGLSVIIGTPTYAVPSWLSDLEPDVLSTTKNGRVLYGHRQLTDLLNPVYLKYADRVTRKMLDVCKDYNDIIIGYQLDNETKSAGAAGEVAQQIFAQRMKEKFDGDLDAFNRAFGLDYWSNKVPSWDNFPDIRGTINGSIDAEYRAFLRDVVSEFHAWLAAIVREYKTPEQFITHNFDFAWTGYSYGMQPEVNQKEAASVMDIAGVDIYHPSQDELTGIEISMGGAIGRSIIKDNYLVLETQAQGRPSWTPFPGQLTLQALSHLASGAGSVMYWHWHSIHNSYETYWKGILSHDLKPNRPYSELSEFGRLMKRIAPSVTYLKKRSDIAIMLDNRSLTGIDEFPSNGEAAFKGQLENDYNHIMRQWFDALYKMNVEADVVYCDDDLSSYRLLIIPSLYSASEETIARIRRFVKEGGHIVITPRCFFSDEYLKVYPDIQPHGFTDLTGGTYNEFTIPSDVGFKGTLPLTGKATYFMEFYTPLPSSDAEVLVSYDHPYWNRHAAVLRHGNVTTVGCYMNEHDTDVILRDVLDHAGIEIPQTVFPVIIKRGTNKAGEEITFVFNYSMTPSKFIFERDYTDLLTSEKCLKGEETQLPAWGYRILRQE